VLGICLFAYMSLMKKNPYTLFCAFGNRRISKRFGYDKLEWVGQVKV